MPFLHDLGLKLDCGKYVIRSFFANGGYIPHNLVISSTFIVTVK